MEEKRKNKGNGAAFLERSCRPKKDHSSHLSAER
jgi:hypothetical protein